MYHSTLLDIYRISVGEKLKKIKRKKYIISLKYTHRQHLYICFTLILKKKKFFQKMLWFTGCRVTVPEISRAEI